MNPYDYMVEPFAAYSFMRRALTACVALSAGGAPLGVFLVLRRLALAGDAMSHAVLPGVSLAFLLFGLNLWAMTLGGLAAGVIVALAAVLISRFTQLKEDSSLTGAYLLSLALGVLLISVKGSTVDLMHVLFGNVLAVDNQALLFVAGIASVSFLSLAVIYRSLIVECFDPGFMKAVKGKGGWVHQFFLLLVVLNLVSAFQALGTMMALGIMILPAIAARFWARNIDGTIGLSILFAFAASYAGLLLSYHADLPSGPSIVLTAGVVYVVSVLFGRYGSVAATIFPPRHFAH